MVSISISKWKPICNFIWQSVPLSWPVSVFPYHTSTPSGISGWFWSRWMLLCYLLETLLFSQNWNYTTIKRTDGRTTYDSITTLRRASHGKNTDIQNNILLTLISFLVKLVEFIYFCYLAVNSLFYNNHHLDSKHPQLRQIPRVASAEPWPIGPPGWHALTVASQTVNRSLLPVCAAADSI